MKPFLGVSSLSAIRTVLIKSTADITLLSLALLDVDVAVEAAEITTMIQGM